MGRKATNSGEVNKSQAIRDLLAAEPSIKAADAISKLKEQGVDVASGLFYLIKGKVVGAKPGRKRGRKPGRKAGVQVVAAASSGKSDAVAVIQKVKGVADQIGGLKALMRIIEALSQ